MPYLENLQYLAYRTISLSDLYHTIFTFEILFTFTAIGPLSTYVVLFVSLLLLQLGHYLSGFLGLKEIIENGSTIV